MINARLLFCAVVVEWQTRSAQTRVGLISRASSTLAFGTKFANVPIRRMWLSRSLPGVSTRRDV